MRASPHNAVGGASWWRALSGLGAGPEFGSSAHPIFRSSGRQIILVVVAGFMNGYWFC